MHNANRYLLALQIVPLEVGRIYDELPAHLTLMSRFLTHLPVDKLSDIVRPIFEREVPIHLTFGETVQLGPKQVTVHMVYSPEEKLLHERLHQTLNNAQVEFEYPQFVGVGHKPHVTARKDTQFHGGDKLVTSVAYLIEIVDKQRVVRERFELGSERI